jgi:hypothetical protein
MSILCLLFSGFTMTACRAMQVHWSPTKVPPPPQSAAIACSQRCGAPRGYPTPPSRVHIGACNSPLHHPCLPICTRSVRHIVYESALSLGLSVEPPPAVDESIIAALEDAKRAFDPFKAVVTRIDPQPRPDAVLTHSLSEGAGVTTVCVSLLLVRGAETTRIWLL